MRRIPGSRFLAVSLVLILVAVLTWGRTSLVGAGRTFLVGAEAASGAAGPLLSGVEPEAAARLIEAAERDAQSAEWRVGRTEPVGVIDAGDGKGPVAVRFINYDQMQPFTVFVDSKTEAVVGSQIDREWPDYSPGERALASSIALSFPEVVKHRTDWVVDNITGSTGLGKCRERRCIVVMLTPPDGDYSDLQILVVDLGLQQVVTVEVGK